MESTTSNSALVPGLGDLISGDPEGVVEGGNTGGKATPASSGVANQASEEGNDTGETVILAVTRSLAGLGDSESDGEESVVSSSGDDEGRPPSGGRPESMEQLRELSRSMERLGKEGEEEGWQEVKKKKRKNKKSGGAQRTARLRKAREAKASRGVSGVEQSTPTVSRGSNADDANGPSKRKREEGDTPACAKVNKKKRSYAAAASSALQLAVVKAGELTSGKLTEEDAAFIRRELVNRLDEVQGKVPQFEASGLSKGIFLISCADQAALDWVKIQVPTLKRGELQYQAVRPDELEKKVKVSTFVPSPSAKETTTAKMLWRLSRQNPDLSTEDWQVVWRDDTNPKGVFLVFLVGEQSVEVLKRLNWAPHFEMSRLRFALKQKSQNEESQQGQ